MGFWATAIGAKQEGKQLVAITGDGSAQMNIQELATLSYNKIPLKLFIYNNDGYMLIRHNQHNYMNDRFSGSWSGERITDTGFLQSCNSVWNKGYKDYRRAGTG